MVEFKEYSRKYKEDEVKYSMMKETVKAEEITGTTHNYYPFTAALDRNDTFWQKTSLNIVKDS